MGRSKSKKKCASYDNDVRGATICKKVIIKRNKGDRYELIWNAKGVPCGPNRKLLSSWIGCCTRRRLSITTNTWKEVPEEQKDMIWEEILVYFFISFISVNIVSVYLTLTFLNFACSLHLFFRKQRRNGC